LQLRDVSLVDLLTFRTRFYFIETPPEYFTHYIPYDFFDVHRTFVVDALKIIYTFVSCVMLRLFFGLYLDNVRAWFASWLLLFYPSHDATAFWFQAYYLPLSLALYACAFYLVRHGRSGLAAAAALAGSFISYGTPPIALALAVMCLLHRHVKGALVLLVPNLIYAAYYLALTSSGERKARLAAELDVSSLVRGVGAQVVSSVDSVAGVSVWLKILYAPLQMSIASILMGLVCGVLLWRVPLLPPPAPLTVG
jgi:hypothetical protein